MNYSDTLYRDFEKLSSENVNLKERILGYQEQCHRLQQSLKGIEKTKEKMQDSYDEQIAKKDAIIKELSNKLAHLEAVSAHNGTNTGISTAATPINKKKIIPNTRRGSSKNRGGQPGHSKHMLSSFEEDEITEAEEHELDQSEVCDLCGGNLTDSGEIVFKDEYDVEIRTVKRRHDYHLYYCSDCGAGVRLQIQSNLKEQNQYGSQTQALALSLMNTGNVPINKVRTLLIGMTADCMHPSEGYIAKLQKRAARGLEMFMSDLKILLIQRNVLYWDDTVIMINTARACLRFYGDESISFFTAHEHKDIESLEDDNILPLLPSSATVMHDHNKVNYNAKFSFQNIECNQHLQRDLQKNTDDTGHKWSDTLKKLIASTIHERKEAVAKNRKKFAPEYIENFKKKANRILKKGKKEYNDESNSYSAPFENALLVRMEVFQNNYFKWVEDFSLPTTDNLSERGLRCVKSHMKISGQFESVKTAGYFAIIKTYIETCRKNGINEMNALSRLCTGEPYTVEEIFQ